MKPTSLHDHPGWQWCTAEGAELHTLLLGLRSSFADKLIWLEQAETLTLAMRAASGKTGTPNAENETAPPLPEQLPPAT